MVNLAQEFVIKNTLLEDKVNELLPSQGGAQAGVDLSASTMIVPVVNLTEAAEGSTLQEDLQRSLSLSSITVFSVLNTSSTVLNTTGYYFFQGSYDGRNNTSSQDGIISITDGVTTKNIIKFNVRTNTAQINIPFSFNVLVKAGESIVCESTGSTVTLRGTFRQIADLSGTLINP